MGVDVGVATQLTNKRLRAVKGRSIPSTVAANTTSGTTWDARTKFILNPLLSFFHVAMIKIGTVSLKSKCEKHFA